MSADLSAELAIRQQRAAFNRAIAAGDAAAIGVILARACVMMTGSDSAVIAGRSAQVKLWKRMFAAGERTLYIRTPQRITLSSVEPIALEQGIWEGRASAGGDAGGDPGADTDAPPENAAETSGVYTAKWRDIGGEWLIEAEIFVTLE